MIGRNLPPGSLPYSFQRMAMDLLYAMSHSQGTTQQDGGKGESFNHPEGGGGGRGKFLGSFNARHVGFNLDFSVVG